MHGIGVHAIIESMQIFIFNNTLPHHMHYNVVFHGNYHHATHKIDMSKHEDVGMKTLQNPCMPY